MVGWFLATSGEHISRFSSNHRSLGHAHASMVVTLASLDYKAVVFHQIILTPPAPLKHNNCQTKETGGNAQEKADIGKTDHADGEPPVSAIKGHMSKE